MASFAKKYKDLGKQEGATEAAEALGIKGKVNKKGEAKQVKAYLKGLGKTASGDTSGGTSSGGDAASSGGKVNYSDPDFGFTATAGGLAGAGYGILAEISRQNRDNEVIGGQVYGAYIDDAKTKINMSNNETYQKNMQDIVKPFIKDVKEFEYGLKAKDDANQGAIARQLIKTKEEEIPLNLRADARGQIRSQGARFFG